MHLRLQRAVACAVLAALAWAGTGGAHAQSPYGGGPGGTPPTRPTVSPYLNLQRRGTSAGINYYGLVRPQLEFRNAYQGLQQQAETRQQGQTVDQRGGLPETGHAAVFLNTQGYFLNSSPGLGQRPGAGSGARPMTPGRQR